MFRHSKRSSLASIAGTTSHSQTRNETISSIFATGFPYSSKLVAHKSCVNALAFSSSDGRLLASGGDDLDIHIWDFHQDDVKTPTCSFRGPKGNIFCLEFSATNRYLYSGGTDENILKYDINHFGSHLDTMSRDLPDQTFYEHDDTIRGITGHPYQDEVFLSASQDGRILQHDGRVNGRSARAQDTIQIKSEVTGVEYHPIMDHIFVSSDTRGNVCLRDVRMAFGPLSNRTREGIVQVYNTKLCKKSPNRLCNPEVSSVTFDREGAKLAVTMLNHYPTIYALADPHPLAVCSGKYLPGGTPVASAKDGTYSNSCSIKHGSFGGPGLDRDQFYCAGSEDFRSYVWKVPELSELAERRIEISSLDWSNQEWTDVTAFSEGTKTPRYIPFDLSTPLFRLTGHSSIVNATLIHPHFLHIVTAGIENHIRLHSPSPNSPCSKDMELTSTDVRQLGDDEDADRMVFLRALAGFHGIDTMDEDEDPERTTIMMFDHILREEGQVDVFGARQWAPDSSDEEDSDDEKSEDDEEDHRI